jgi:hypothetical protein
MKAPKKRGECSQGLPARRAPFCTERSGGKSGGGRIGSVALILDGMGEVPPKIVQTGLSPCFA